MIVAPLIENEVARYFSAREKPHATQAQPLRPLLSECQQPTAYALAVKLRQHGNCLDE